MIHTTFVASLLPYSETFPALRAVARVTAIAGLGCTSFIDLIEPHAGAIAYILQHGPDQPPARVEQEFRHLCFRECRSVHVADEDGALSLQSTVESLRSWSFREFLIFSWSARTRVYFRASCAFGSSASSLRYCRRAS